MGSGRMIAYSDSVKNGIVLEYLHGGHTVTSLSEMYGIPYTTVYRWLRTAGVKVQDQCNSIDSRWHATSHLADVNEQLYALVQNEQRQSGNPRANTTTDDIVSQLKKIETCLNKLTYAIYVVAYKDALEEMPEDIA